MKTAFQKAVCMGLPASFGLHNPDPVSKVLGFHHCYDVPVAEPGNRDEAFAHMSNDRVAMRLGLVIEEVKELFKDGFGIKLLVNLDVPDTLNKQGMGMQFFDTEVKKALDRAEREGLARDGEQVADAAGDIIYVVIGMLIEMGYDVRPVVEEIHASNLTKLGADGKPILREDGKVLKGPNYMKPNIRAALGWEN